EAVDCGALPHAVRARAVTRAQKVSARCFMFIPIPLLMDQSRRMALYLIILRRHWLESPRRAFFRRRAEFRTIDSFFTKLLSIPHTPEPSRAAKKRAGPGFRGRPCTEFRSFCPVRGRAAGGRSSPRAPRPWGCSPSFCRRG